MPGADRVLINVMLENALLKKNGQAFQDFFVLVGTTLWRQDFEPWSPQGRFGDLKCDGYRISDKTVFQCYAPEVFTPQKVIAKMQTDFAGARDAFGNKMRKWVFVHNRDRGLYPTINMLISELREEHRTITIETWGPTNLIQLLLDLPENDLGILFPTLVKEQQFTAATWKTIEEVAKSNRISAPGFDVKPQSQMNRLALDGALDDLEEVDREVRRRVLGYSRWYDPAAKTRVFQILATFGHGRELVENNAQRLRDDGLIQITENHYLPLNEEICQQAAESLLDEFLRELEE